jgi:hypothetical protein
MWRIRIKHRARLILTSLAVYISVTGLVTFSLFILEESIQTAQFGTWPAQDAGDWITVKFGVERMKEANRALKIMNYSIGWIQPLAFIAYRAYGRSSDAYIAGCEAKLFAHAPEVYDGEVTTFTYRPETITGALYSTRRISVSSKFALVLGQSSRITGRVTVNPDQTVVVNPP